MAETVEESRCARCGCTAREHHKLHCEGRDGNCRCSGGWAGPGTPLTAFDKVCQAENAEYDAARAQNSCRAVEVPTEAHGAVLVHLAGGTEPLTEKSQDALSKLVDAVVTRVERENPHLGVIQELAQTAFRARMVLREANHGDLANRLAVAVDAARKVLRTAPAIPDPPVYDGRISASCKKNCDAGMCHGTPEPCGGCCGCLGGCVRGYEEQIEEASTGC